MEWGRTFLGRGAGTLAFSAAATLLSATGVQASLKTIECQRPVRTGEEIYHLKNVSAKTACPVVRDLGRWERMPGHITKLYKCVGRGRHTPVLKLHSFEGWRMSLTMAGDFQMSRPHNSFDVTGTDFPINCS